MPKVQGFSFTFTSTINFYDFQFHNQEAKKTKWKKTISKKKILTTALKRVDFPTLGRPTIPALRLMLILEDDDEEENGFPLPRPPSTSTVNRQWLLCCFIGTSRDGIKLLQAILAIFHCLRVLDWALEAQTIENFLGKIGREKGWTLNGVFAPLNSKIQTFCVNFIFTPKS